MKYESHLSSWLSRSLSVLTSQQRIFWFWFHNRESRVSKSCSWVRNILSHMSIFTWCGHKFNFSLFWTWNDFYQLCRSLPQSWGQLRVSLLPGTDLKDDEFWRKNKLFLLTCWEGSSSSCSQQSIPRSPFQAPVEAQGRWLSELPANNPSPSSSRMTGSCSASPPRSAGKPRSWGDLICFGAQSSLLYLTRPGWFE